MRNIHETAALAIETVLGTASEPVVSPISYGEGHRIAVNQLRARRGTAGFNICEQLTNEELCRHCEIIGSKICSLVQDLEQ